MNLSRDNDRVVSGADSGKDVEDRRLAFPGVLPSQLRGKEQRLCKEARHFPHLRLHLH